MSISAPNPLQPELHADRHITGTAGAPTMKAIVQDAYGTEPERCSGSPRSPGPRSQTTRSWCGCVPPAWTGAPGIVMTGLPYPMRLVGFGFRAPKAPNPGRSFAGTVEAVGQDVTGFEPGDEVYGTCDGSFAEYARAQASRLAPKPANLSFEQAAAVPDLRGHRAAGACARAQVQAGAAGAGRRRVRRRRHVRRADRQGVRRRGHRRVQHRQGRTWSAPSAPTT